MHPIQKHLFDTNFRDLAGTKIEGTLVLSDEIINLGLGELLLQLKAAGKEKKKPVESEAGQTAGTPLPDPRTLIGLLDVEKLEFRTEKGRSLLDVEASIKA